MTHPAKATVWIPKVLTDYEVGRSVSAIETIARSDKPVAEVGCQQVILADLEDDLAECLKLANVVPEVRFWTKASGVRFRYGFYKEAWVLGALDFLDRAQLGETERAWISGLLFGYRSGAIQQYIARESGSVK
jgi:hypothetical protein